MGVQLDNFVTKYVGEKSPQKKKKKKKLKSLYFDFWIM